MDILVCIKRVPVTGAKVTLTADEQEIDASYLSFAPGPHEECAIEEAVQIAKKFGGKSTALTLGPDAAIEQLRYAASLGIDDLILLETDGDWPPMPTARAITTAVQAQEKPFDALLFGNESADAGGYQVGIRVAHALGLPVVTGVKKLEFEADADGKTSVATAHRQTAAGWELYEVPLPAVFTVKEGINVPRYPSIPGKLRAKKKPIQRITPEKGGVGLEKVRLVVPESEDTNVNILGYGPDAAPQVAELLNELGLV
ncbi:MAG: electron transfer flavoprotein subunit beta/FixA family protein [Chloroflexi bacterium]|nr:electron transfer flavoprotein subunit beta/FixA family protein [Chloroflexota bacterium]